MTAADPLLVPDTSVATSDVGRAIPGPTRSLSNDAAALQFSDISEDALRVARHCLIDWLGVSLAGCREDCARIVKEQVLEQGGIAEATIIGSEPRVPAAQAALVNGTSGHALDFDDVNYALHGHATVAVAPAVFALAEASNSTLDDILTAFVAGVEFAGRAAQFVGGSHYTAGWHATSTLGSLGAAAGCARLLCLDGEATAHAVGLSATQASGLKSMFGSMAKPLHAGRAARTGIEAACLTARGFSTREDSLECEQGMSDAMSGAASSVIGHPEFSNLTLKRTQGKSASNPENARFVITDTLFKYHASCFETHATIEACQMLREKITNVNAIDNVRVQVRPANFKICNIDTPTNGLQAKFSLKTTAAMALLGVDTGDFENFNQSLIDDKILSALCQRIDIVADDKLRKAQSRVTIATKAENDSAPIEQFWDASIPATDLEAQEARIVGKFERLAEKSIDNVPIAAVILGKDASTHNVSARLNDLMCDFRRA